MTSGNKMGLPAWSQTSTDSKEQSRIRGTSLTHLMKAFSPLTVVNNLKFMKKKKKIKLGVRLVYNISSKSSVYVVLYVKEQACSFMLRPEAQGSKHIVYRALSIIPHLVPSPF